MKVKLIKVADYDLDESKTVKMDYDVFRKMVGGMEGEGMPCRSMRVFSNIEEFKSCDERDLDTSESVHVLKNGNICVFLKEYKVQKIVDSNVVAADTKKDKGE